jgi:hypothetical protein
MLGAAFSYKIDFLVKVVERYVKSLQRIISSSPPTTKMMTVYRGVKTDLFFNGNANTLVKTDGLEYYQNQGFVSTSLDSKVAYGFLHHATNGNKCCMQHITILPGSHCVMLQPITVFPEENEILLGNNTLYYIRGKKHEKVHPTGINLCSALKDNEHVKVTVSDIVVVR